MLFQCENLIELQEISKWNLKDVIDVKNIFNICSSLKNLPGISKWETNNLEYVTGIFCWMPIINIFT